MGKRLGRLILPLVGALVAVALAFGPACARTFAQTTSAKTLASAADISGVWTPQRRTYTLDPSDPLGLKPERGPAMTPWGQAKFKENKPAHGANQTVHPNDPFFQCFPPGVPRIYMEAAYPLQIFQLPDRVLMLFEYDHWVRQIYTDGRGHPKDLDPTWMGNAIGKWEGNTFVVDSVGFNDKTWLDRVGHPHSENLHVIERIRRVDPTHLENDITIDDPKAYTQTWGGQKTWNLSPGQELLEDVCLDMGNDYGQYQDKAGFSGTPGGREPASPKP